jgi:DNA-directed RNA polymerase specialized sigma24 family protein
MPPHPSARFPSTAWSCVREAQNPNDTRFVTAMNRLISTYWRPVFHFLRARGCSAQDAEDLTQDFFLRFLARGWLRPADPGRGRFRDFLLTLVKRFAHDRTVRATNQVKFEKHLVSVHSLVQDSDRAYEPPDHETPEEAWHRQWKAELLAAVRRNLCEHYEGLTRPEKLLRYEIFAAAHFVDRLDDQPAQDTLAARFSVTREQVRYALEEVGKRYQRFLRQELRAQVGSEEEIDEEIKRLL